MPYLKPFHRMVAIGTIYGDVFNWGLAIGGGLEGSDAIGNVDDELLDAVADAVKTSWESPFSGVGLGVSNEFKLTSLKLNLIGTDGKYISPTTFEHVYSSPVAGATIFRPAPQLASVVSLTTGAARGPASKGRFYLPPCTPAASLDSTGRMGAADALKLAQQSTYLIEAINAQYALHGNHVGLVPRVSVVSNVRTGGQRTVRGVRVGRVVDTVRSRRNRLDEDYQEDSVATP